MNCYRLQLTPDHGLAAAARTLSYLYRLGVTVAYTSPFFVAGSDSSGYDVCDYTHIQPELGSVQQFTGSVFAKGVLPGVRCRSRGSFSPARSGS